MHLRLGQAAWHDAQDQAPRPQARRPRFHAQHHRLQSRPAHQIGAGVSRSVSGRCEMTAKAVKTAPMTLASALINASKKEARSDFVVFQRTASDLEQLQCAASRNLL